jgi:uncharacterized repeat protein (TIGR03803 family)
VLNRYLAAASAFAAGLLAVAVPQAMAATTSPELYSFAGGADGYSPHGPVIFGYAGDLYGTTQYGGAHDDGTVFQLVPSSSGSWTKHTLYSFAAGADGTLPDAGLTRDARGDLFGTVYQGGAGGHGAVFELVRGVGNTWTKRNLYSFSGGNDGGLPTAGLTRGPGGVLYGTTSGGGADGQGVVFELTPGTSGWTETVLHSFTWPSGGDGAAPSANLTLGSGGNLFGTTVSGGAYDMGIAFELSPGPSGWTETILHTFTGGKDGGEPMSDLRFDGATLIGTTTSGGSGNGVVYRLRPPGTSNPNWSERVLFTFAGGASGGQPFAGVVLGKNGAIYGTTSTGVYGAGGVVYKLSMVAGVWTENVLYTYENAGNGSYADITRDAEGNLYSTTPYGGSYKQGDVVEVAP